MNDDPSLTLRQAHAHFCATPTAAHRHPAPSSESATAFLQHHDVAHVVFGCDTSLRGEGVVKVFTIWGTTLGFRGHLSAYADASALELYRQYSVRHLTQQFGALLVAMPQALIRARRMHKRWPWSEHEQYLDVPLDEIRREFNIKVLT